MKLFYKTGACSLATHIVLYELGLEFKIDEVDTDRGLTKAGQDYKTINPKGYVPALQLDTGEVLTEGPSILQYLADQHPEKKLVPEIGTLARTRLLEYLNYTGSELHKAFGPLFSKSTDAEKEQAKANVGKKFDYVEDLLRDGREYLVGNNFSVADSYLFVVSNWSNFVGIDLKKWPSLAAYVDRVSKRTAVQTAMKAEGLI
jgi:glutathione S-transferase|tara:strand:- start:53913 stop:54518 length:606 start_codon:yes stop_codon:yes gene_type:complete